eukprot:GEMP01010509.1.p1 GENE.GEMP01010509.1~~GEMP01010509.1.p1  ORF type:complete len:318 (+),score=53.88 GEMP01010509.1:167-1120(+)
MQPFPKMFRCCFQRRWSMADAETRNGLFENKEAENDIRISRRPSKSGSENDGPLVSIPDVDSFHSIGSENERLEDEALLQCVTSGMLGPYSNTVVARLDGKGTVEGARNPSPCAMMNYFSLEDTTGGKATEDFEGSQRLIPRRSILPKFNAQLTEVEPTLPPLIGFETLQRIRFSAPPAINTWSELQGTEFKVRCGPNYKKTHQKVRSARNMYNCIGCDVMKNDDLISDIAEMLPMRNIDIPYLPPDCGVPAVVILNIQLVPEGGGWGSSTPKMCASFCIYSVISAQTAALVGTDKEPAQCKLLREMTAKKCSLLRQ